jgi:hypothetical protein
MEETMNTLKSLVTAAVAACSIALAYNTPANAYDRTVRLVNDTGRTIVEFYASNVGTDSWQEDILGDHVLPPGRSALLDMDDGTGYCVFDFKTVLRDGTSVIRRRVNVCDVGAYRLSASW